MTRRPTNQQSLVGPARRPVRPTARSAAVMALAFAVLGGCSGMPPAERGRLISHTRNGVPEFGSPNAGVTRRVGQPMRDGAVDGPSGLRTVDLVWNPGAPAPADGRPVNVFGEMDGMPRAAAPVAGDAGYQQHTFTDEGADSDVSTDPSGKWLLFASTRHSEHADIYLQRADGTTVTQLTSDAAEDAYPCFSPDGRQIAFASTRAGTWQIYVMDPDGRNVVQVTSGTMQCIHPSFSPDGTRLVYSAIGSRSNQWELWVADLRTGEKRMIGYGLFPRWSPDRTVDRIAYQRPRQRGGRWFSLWTIDLIEGEGRRMTEVAASTNAAIVSPCWSPDGRRLAFATVLDPSRAATGGGRSRAGAGKGAPSSVETRTRQDIWTIDADGGNRQRLTDGNGTNLSPCWAADSRIYFISDRGGAECVWSVHADAPRGNAMAGAVIGATTAPPSQQNPAAQPEAKPVEPANAAADPSEANR
jgi:TolB protein